MASGWCITKKIHMSEWLSDFQPTTHAKDPLRPRLESLWKAVLLTGLAFDGIVIRQLDNLPNKYGKQLTDVVSPDPYLG